MTKWAFKTPDLKEMLRKSPASNAWAAIYLKFFSVFIINGSSRADIFQDITCLKITFIVSVKPNSINKENKEVIKNY